jgi:hypothetical protein
VAPAAPIHYNICYIAKVVISHSFGILSFLGIFPYFSGLGIGFPEPIFTQTPTPTRFSVPPASYLLLPPCLPSSCLPFFVDWQQLQVKLLPPRLSGHVFPLYSTIRLSRERKIKERQKGGRSSGRVKTYHRQIGATGRLAISIYTCRITAGTFDFFLLVRGVS